VLLAYRHGLRAAEVVDFGGSKSTSIPRPCMSAGSRTAHQARTLTCRELRELRRHQRESAKSPFLFVSERGAPFSAPLGIKAHAHMLRHACGYKLANDGIDKRSKLGDRQLGFPARASPCAAISISRMSPHTRSAANLLIATRHAHCAEFC
jgi:hypothetical protein